MTTRQANLAILFIFGTFIIFRTIFPAAVNDSFSSTLFNLSIELVGGILFFGLLSILKNIKNLYFYYQTQFKLRNKDIRISIAYLYRINVNGKYLLVKNSRRNYFQPVGGAFKTLPGSEKIFESLNVKRDRLIETENGIAKNDLRVFVKGINVIDFLEWYNSKVDRETSPWREFCEELISPNILPWKEFRYIDYKYKGTIQTPIIKLSSNDKGMFIYEIFDLVPNNEQIAILEKLQKEGNTEEYIWADAYLINRLGHNESNKEYIHEIAPHTKWALNMNWTNE
jgi:hypothetical protein